MVPEQNALNTTQNALNFLRLKDTVQNALNTIEHYPKRLESQKRLAPGTSWRRSVTAPRTAS